MQGHKRSDGQTCSGVGSRLPICLSCTGCFQSNRSSKRQHGSNGRRQNVPRLGIVRRRDDPSRRVTRFSCSIQIAFRMLRVTSGLGAFLQPQPGEIEQPFTLRQQHTVVGSCWL
eukprot:scaffold264494_cov27-Tisochrysis_lutea.AAC.5